MAPTYRVGLVGCGRMGTTIDDEVRDRPNAKLFLPYSHAAAVVACERTDLVAVSDPVADKAETARSRFGAQTAYEDPEEMIRQEGLDIVCIATRPSPHAPITQFAAEHGVRGIYCEKPLCNSMAEADRMAAAIHKHGVKFNYGAQRRYVRMYRNLLDMIAAGQIGELQAVIAYCGASAAQWGHTHAADMLLMLAGDGPVDWVQGTARFEAADWDGDRLTLDPPIETGTIRFANGVTGSLVPAGGYEFEASGTQGKLRTLSNGSSYTWRRVGEHGDLEDAVGPNVPIESGTLRAMDDLVRALDDDAPTQGGIEVACRSQEIILGLVASHRAHGARVPMPLTDRALSIRPDNY